MVVSSIAGEQRAKETTERRVVREQEKWEKTLWHLGNREFACEADAQAALSEATRKLPAWLEVSARVNPCPRYAKAGRPGKDARPQSVVWRVRATLNVNQEGVEREWRRRACFIVGTNILDTSVLSDEQVTKTYKEQGGVESGGSASSRTRCFWRPRCTSRNPPA